jgi:Glycogen debranching enzyme N terminal
MRRISKKLMITIRSSKPGSEATFVCMDVTLKTPRNIYTISSDGPLADSGSTFVGGVFGAISWPVSRFRLAAGLHLEQQMFLPHNGSTVAMSWTLHGETPSAAQLAVSPFFSGCGPRSYRDAGFHVDSESQGGRLVWLPNVLGPKVFADTNGRYHDEALRSLDCFCEKTAASGSTEDLVTPGRFEFELGRRPSVLIFSIDGFATAHRDQHVGLFLAGLMQDNSSGRSASTITRSVFIETDRFADARLR